MFEEFQDENCSSHLGYLNVIISAILSLDSELLKLFHLDDSVSIWLMVQSDIWLGTRCLKKFKMAALVAILDIRNRMIFGNSDSSHKVLDQYILWI